MNCRLGACSLLLLIATQSTALAQTCGFAAQARGDQRIGQWIDRGNWLADEHLRLTLTAGPTFMPSLLLAPGKPSPLRSAGRNLDVDKIKASDPLDGSARNLGFLLDSRLQADGLLVLHNGRLLAERYRNGLQAADQRLLLQANRPLLNLLGAISVAQGKLSADRSLSRYLPAMSNQSGLRRLSVQRLLDSNDATNWSSEELASWREAAGWTTGGNDIDIRAWLAAPGRWDFPMENRKLAALPASPDDDLLAWLLAESNKMPLSRLFCEQLLSRSNPEHPVAWMTDEQGIELAGGLALSLRDFGRLGQLLLDARSSRSRGRIPGWFIETLTASAGLRTGQIPGLARGSERRYGFIHLGGEPNRVALVGAHGSSLYIDFDRRLVIALYASHPALESPSQLATLEQLWKTLARTAVPAR
ncbi:MAG: beta-lactamase family protein [Dechloromonas sp.]|nr:MAG: beta-lactamase family protein [Dechloromonas sp.]